MHVVWFCAKLNKPLHDRLWVTGATDYTGKMVLKDLFDGSLYTYRVWFDDRFEGRRGQQGAIQGTFRTPPQANVGRELTFAWGGDVGGQNVCRDAGEGYAIFRALSSRRPDFFVGLGDMIYADNTCEATGRYGNRQVRGDFGPSTDIEGFWAHWRYNRADPAAQDFFSNATYYAVWDDHEVVSDFGPRDDTREEPPYTPGAHLMPVGRRAFLDYNPVRENAGSKNQLYRTVRWGKSLELFILDNRQYRDAIGEVDSGDPEERKTMLGADQLAWLKAGLSASDAVWKFVVSSVPMSVPTGWPPEKGRDGWANFDQETGYEHELVEILRHMQGLDSRNLVWITTDVHFAEIFRYRPFEEDPDFVLHEIISGPMSAGLFPNRDFDDTLHPESLFFHGPEGIDTVKTWEEARTWMNFGTVRIDRAGLATLSIVGIDGESLFELSLEPESADVQNQRSKNRNGADPGE